MARTKTGFLVAIAGKNYSFRVRHLMQRPTCSRRELKHVTHYFNVRFTFIARRECRSMDAPGLTKRSGSRLLQRSPPSSEQVLANPGNFRHYCRMHTYLPSVSKRKTSAIAGAGIAAFTGFKGSVSIRATSISIIRITKGR